MTVKLISVGDWTRENDFSIGQLPAVLGRGADADVRVNDRWVSRRHCQIDRVDGRLVVRDLESSHGTIVNGDVITEAVLEPGDMLSVGLTSFVAEYDREEAVAVTA